MKYMIYIISLVFSVLPGTSLSFGLNEASSIPWQPVSPEEASQIFGGGITHDNNDSYAGSEAIADGGDGAISSIATYRLTSMTVSLNIQDIPLAYTPPVGPPVNFHLSYNQREVSQPANFFVSNVGPNWTHNYLTWIEDDPKNAGKLVSRYVRGGGLRTYEGYDGESQTFSAETRTHALLVRVSDEPIIYERRLNDGSIEVYSQSDGQTERPRRVYLTQVRDSTGNSLTLDYVHHNNQPRLSRVVDASGQGTTFSYHHQDPLLITEVRDPFGREAKLSYDDQGRLSAITDVSGLTSRFSYVGETTFIESMSTPYGTTRFSGGGKGNKRWLEATDPLGNTERIEFRHDAPGILFSDPDFIKPIGMNVFNAEYNLTNTYYWDKTTHIRAPGDYTQALIRHWLHDKTGLISSHQLGWIKMPQKARIFLTYPGQEYPFSASGVTQERPRAIGRVLPGQRNEVMLFDYTLQGHIARVTDPSGRETLYDYSADGIDLIEVQQKTKQGTEVLLKATWNSGHRPLTMTDASGQTIYFKYNDRGQPIQITSAQDETTHLEYNEKGYLLRVVDSSGKTQTSYGYDDFGRIAHITDAQENKTEYRYDALDRITEKRYPDGTTEIITWEKLDPVSIKDRQGRITHYHYDALRRLVSVTDPAGRQTRYGYDADKRLISLTDSEDKVTRWQYDNEGQLISSTDPDGQQKTQTWDSAGRLLPMNPAKSSDEQAAIELPNIPILDIRLATDSGLSPILSKVLSRDQAQALRLIGWSFDAHKEAQCGPATYGYLACVMKDQIEPKGKWPWCGSSMVAPGYPDELPLSTEADQSEEPSGMDDKEITLRIPTQLLNSIKAKIEAEAEQTKMVTDDEPGSGH